MQSLDQLTQQIQAAFDNQKEERRKKRNKRKALVRKGLRKVK